MDRDNMMIPRSIRCTKAEHRFLSDLIKRMREQKSESAIKPDVEPVVSEPEVIARNGISPEDFLKSRGLPVIETPEEPEQDAETDYTEWQSDCVMIEIDRGCCYEIDSMGYPEEAERFARRYPEIWKKLYVAKQNKKTDVYNEIMYKDVWEIVKNGRF